MAKHKLFPNVIGQTPAVNHFASIIESKLRADSNDKVLHFVPEFLMGETGNGKTFLAEAIVAALPGYQLIEFPINAGMNDIKRIANDIASIDDAGATAIPSVILIDEAHALKGGVKDFMKLVIGATKPKVIERAEGKTRWFADPNCHLIILCSNQKTDDALVGRCEKIHLTPFSANERAEIIKANCNGINFTADALKWLVGHVRGNGRAISIDLCPKIKRSGLETVTLTDAQKITELAQLYPMGLEIQHLTILLNLVKEPKPVNVFSIMAYPGLGLQQPEQIIRKCCDMTAGGLVVQNSLSSFYATKKGQLYIDAYHASLKEAKVKTVKTVKAESPAVA